MITEAPSPPAGADYAAALSWLHELGRFGTRLGLSRMIRLLEALGNPQEGLRALHVTGTNGKGSTCAVLAELLAAEGLRVGLYTSPHLSAFEERIRVDGRPIEPESVASLLGRVRAAAERLMREGMDPPTEFEAITALGWLYFAKRRVDRVVLEVGLGGRHDATNVLDPPLVSVITGVALDHTDRLGGTLREIARDKAGIIKPEVPVVAAAPAEALAVIRSVAAEADAPLWVVGEETAEADGQSPAPDVAWRARQVDRRGCAFDLRGPWGRYSALRTPLLGRHQIGNAAVAIAAWHAARAQQPAAGQAAERALRRALAATRWPGRLEVSGDRPALVLDGAHNPDGAAALSRALDELWPDRPVRLVAAMLADKPAAAVLRPLLRRARAVFASQVQSPRALPAEALAAIAREVAPPGVAVHALPDPCEAAAAALGTAQPEDVVLVTGSLYLVGAVRPTLLHSTVQGI